MKIEMEWQPSCRVQLVFPPRISFFRGESPVIHQNFYAISDRGNRLFSEAHFKIFHLEMGPFETGQFTRVIDRFEALKTDFSPHPNTRINSSRWFVCADHLELLRFTSREQKGQMRGDSLGRRGILC